MVGHDSNGPILHPPAYYQTNWFRALCALLLLLLAWAGYQLRIRRLHRQFEMTLDARVAERTRIARDLHDTLLQSFHGLLLRFQTAFNLLPDRPAESKQVLASAIDQAAEAITEGRDAVQGLRTSATEMNDLADSIRALGEELADENSAEAVLRVEVQGTPRALHPIVRDEVFRIAGEALRNAFRHAAAKQIEVELRYDVRQLRVRVRDDGKGIDPEVLRAGGTGRALRVGRNAGAREARRRQAHGLERAGCGNRGGIEHSRAARVQSLFSCPVMSENSARIRILCAFRIVGPFVDSMRAKTLSTRRTPRTCKSCKRGSREAAWPGSHRTSWCRRA